MRERKKERSIFLNEDCKLSLVTCTIVLDVAVQYYNIIYNIIIILILHLSVCVCVCVCVCTSGKVTGSYLTRA